MSLSAEERGRGWVEFHCPVHGFLVATTAEAVVACKCRKRCIPMRGGNPVPRTTMDRIKASTKALQMGTSKITIRPL
jgi:hypothetical protein